MEENTSAHDVRITIDTRRYRIRGLENNFSPHQLRVNILATRDELVHMDTLDLCQAKSRTSFIRATAAELYLDEPLVKQDVGKLLLQLEQLREAQLTAATACDTLKKELSAADRRAAIDLLRSPELVRRILDDYGACGLVGEETNKLVCYLACVSRLLKEPLAVLIQSGSAAGKTRLMDATLAFMPEEHQVRYSAMTGQSLYYMGAQDLKHKILAVAEEEGVAQASYALKLLQSDGQLRIAAAGKNSGTGRQQTETYEVEGPVMMFLTTTSQTPDPELQNRCLTLHVNESAAQTAAIHARQRAAYTLQGQDCDSQRETITRLHQNAQRLLESIPVVIPWAERLQFRHDQTRMRRDHAKYLSLIASITLLHQHQRQKKTRQLAGETIVYLEAALEDVLLANRLASEIMGQSLDELLPQTRQLLELLVEYVNQRLALEKKPASLVRFTQRELRESLGWGDFQLRRHLARLVELEYVLAYRTGARNQREYRLLYEGQGADGNGADGQGADGQKKFVLGLVNPSLLHSEPAVTSASSLDPEPTATSSFNPQPTARTPISQASTTQNDHPELQNDHLASQNDARSMPLRSASDAPSMGEKNGASTSPAKTLRATNAKRTQKMIKRAP